MTNKLKILDERMKIFKMKQEVLISKRKGRKSIKNQTET